MSGSSIEQITIPSSLDADEARAFVEAIEVGNVVLSDALGTPDVVYAPAEELPQYQNPYMPRRLLAARAGGRIVGVTNLQTTVGEGADTSWVQVFVHPEARRRGHGSALAARVEELARSDGRRKLIAYVPGRGTDGPRLASPTGFGSVSAEATSTRFLLGRGYRLEQVERLSRLGLPVPDLEERFARARHESGAEYRVHTWVGRTPERWLDDRAVLITRMSTDAPTAGLDEPEDVWTADRVRENDDRQERNPRHRLFAAAEHVATGHLVGFTMLSAPVEEHRAVQQYPTLVLREHRGHRLGMLVKLANLVQLDRVAPGHPSVLTYNAEENRPMLDVNEKLGFAAIAYEGAWRKDLT